MSNCPEPQRCFDCGLHDHKRGDPACLHILSDTEAQQEPAPTVDTETTLSPSPERVIDQFFTKYVSRENMSSPTEEDDTVSTNTSANVAVATESDPSWGEECGSAASEQSKQTRGPLDRFLRKARASATENSRKTSQEKEKQPASQKRPRDSPPAVAS
uniref:Uncharacterized protein n=1 Tax=Branchiostoma floridae TaxID=7739 RepID=C3YRT5_BRAFL|eukprot:XP_002600828.1 hypothetical protein BRAFLDRAFT_75881 [Branchiostoma floridae]